MGGAWWLWRRLLTGPAVNWGDPYVAAVLVGSLAALVGGAWWLWWWLPKRQVTRLALKIRDPKARADTEDNFRKTVGQALGGAAVLIGAGAAYLQFSQQQQASHDLLISNQVAKGFEQLASDKLTMRLGGIYGLEGVMNTSEQYRVPVLEALCAFVRDGTIGKTVSEAGPATDIQAALTVIARRTDGPGAVNLSKVNIPGADLKGANLRFSMLDDANLSGATMINAKLSAADFVNANLSGANLDSADLTTVSLEAKQISADLRAMMIVQADGPAFSFSTSLSGAKLRGAMLWRAKLWGANLSGADLSGDLIGAHLDGQAQLDKACGTDAKLPPGLTLNKPCPKLQPGPLVPPDHTPSAPP